jgi:hypothetical protein
MKVLWLNDSLVLRADDVKERQALSVLYESLEPKEPACDPTGSEESAITKSLTV